MYDILYTGEWQEIFYTQFTENIKHLSVYKFTLFSLLKLKIQLIQIMHIFVQRKIKITKPTKTYPCLNAYFITCVEHQIVRNTNKCNL